MSENLERLLELNIQASNRTTHAVRAFVRFLFIQLVAITLAGFLIAVGGLFPEAGGAFFFVLGFLVWIIGVFVSSSAGWSELALSDVPVEKDGFVKTSSLDEGPSSSEIKVNQERAEKRMTESNKSDWIMAGRPDLSTWDVGYEDFNSWLERQ